MGVSVKNTDKNMKDAVNRILIPIFHNLVFYIIQRIGIGGLNDQLVIICRWAWIIKDFKVTAEMIAFQEVYFSKEIFKQPVIHQWQKLGACAVENSSLSMNAIVIVVLLPQGLFQGIKRMMKLTTHGLILTCTQKFRLYIYTTQLSGHNPLH